MSPRLRADRLLVERGLFESRAKAQAAIAAGLVTADDLPVRKASDDHRGRRPDRRRARPSVGLARRRQARGGARPHRARCRRAGLPRCRRLDRRLHPGADRARRTARLGGRCRTRPASPAACAGIPPSSRWRRPTSAASIPARLAERPSVLVADVSFISLKHVLPAALALVAPRAQLLVLVKPQFEAPRSAIKKGIVRDAAVRQAVCDDMAATIVSLGCTVRRRLPGRHCGPRRQPGILHRSIA